MKQSALTCTCIFLRSSKSLSLRRNPHEVWVTAGQNHITRIIFILLQTSIRLSETNIEVRSARSSRGPWAAGTEPHTYVGKQRTPMN